MDELAKRMMELAEKVGPDAMAAARGAVRVEAYSMMASSVVCIIAAIACFKGGSYLWAYVSESQYSMGEPKFFAGILFLATAILAWIAIWNVIDPWTWTAINNPDLWLAKKILKL
jgi:hypothetical protein